MTNFTAYLWWRDGMFTKKGSYRDHATSSSAWKWIFLFCCHVLMRFRLHLKSRSFSFKSLYCFSVKVTCFTSGIIPALLCRVDRLQIITGGTSGIWMIRLHQSCTQTSTGNLNYWDAAGWGPVLCPKIRSWAIKLVSLACIHISPALRENKIG